MKILFTFVGNRDPFVEGGEEYGPVLAHLESAAYGRVYLIYTGPEYLERARSVEEIAKGETENRNFKFIDLALDSPVDYEEIYAKLQRAVKKIGGSPDVAGADRTVLLDPGTPQMQTSWFLLVKSGEFAARLLQGVPPRFAGGAYKVRTIDLNSPVLPNISSASPTTGAGTEILFQSEKPFWAEGAEEEDSCISFAQTEIIGSSPAFRDALGQAKRAAPYDTVTVLLRGATGTGKGLFARYIHHRSPRTHKPFTQLNCSALSSTLVESELFGHKKGAFTSAAADRLGKFRSADGGTIFLDEIGDLPPEVQPKLLKVIEEKSLSPVGDDREYTVDVRIIAATNKNLEEEVEEGRFRRDLYERLKQIVIFLPPLSERPEDIPKLVSHFLDKWNRTYGESKKLSAPCWEILLGYEWPGNVREVENVIINLCASCRNGEIGPELLNPALRAGAGGEADGFPVGEITLPENGIDLKAFLHQAERQFFEKALETAGGNKETAARLLGLNGPAFRKACRDRFGIE